ncbi:MAG TPA: hypothetical protein VNW95_03560 [Mucilaginibacter sp.]|jgi:hypothetical protein|nr:hypothetical protein [Mucilaginibacter sp.]
MHSVKTAQIFFCLAVLLFIAKPFLGFSMFTRVHPPAAENIFIKAFNKRKLEYRAGGSYDMSAVQKKLADPVNPLFLPFLFLLDILFPLIFAPATNITGGLLRRIKLNLSPTKYTYLLNGKLII